MEMGGFVKKEHGENGIRVIDEFELTHMSLEPGGNGNFGLPLYPAICSDTGWNKTIEFVDHGAWDELVDWEKFDKIVDASEPPDAEAPKTIDEWLDWLIGH